MDAQGKYERMIVKPWAWLEATKQAKQILQGKARYRLVSGATGVPWEVVGIAHIREGDGDWRTHLANGDSLKRRTVHEPKGLPRSGTPPFGWEEAAIAALEHEPTMRRTSWTLDDIADALEEYNGVGYRRRGLPSPYVWSGSQWYTKGKYVVDGKFDPEAIDKQVGGMILLKRVRDLDK